MEIYKIRFFCCQIVSLLPLYLLELCYGMNSGFTAILTPQLWGDCAEFDISLDQLSWIGQYLISTLETDYTYNVKCQYLLI